MADENNQKLDKYLELSHRFAIKQLIEKWQFESEINRELFNREMSLDELISEAHNVIKLSDDEYRKIYEIVKKN